MKIVVLEPLFNEFEKNNFRQTLSKLSHEVVFYEHRSEEKSEIINRSNDADILILSNIPIDKEVLKNCKNLKLINVAFTGVEHIDIEFCKEKGISVCNSSGYSTQSVAELTIGLILDLLRKISQLDLQTKNNNDRCGFVGQELSGKVVGIVGCGLIGAKVGELLKCFGCEVYYFSRTKKKDIGWGEYLEFEQLLKISDIITLHTPLTIETENLINKSNIALMKSSAIIINTSRGKVINYFDLADALSKGKISGAGIDIYEYEPPLKKEHPLLSVDNCILTPHIAYATREAFEKRAEIVVNNVYCWLSEKPQNLIF